MSADELRPDTLDGYIGQPKMKARLTIHARAARAQERPLEHVLLTGPPGSGKTTLARIIAHMVGDPFMSLAMPVNDRVFERTFSTHRGVLFLDEVHRMSTRQMEAIMPALEFGRLTTMTGRVIENDWLTVIAATTEAQKVIPPLRQRFPIIPEQEEYTPEDMARIVENMGRMAGIKLSPDLAAALGTAAAGTPRQARRLVLGARDLIAVGEEPTIEAVFALTGASVDGLTEAHVKYLKALDLLGGVSGIELISSVLQLHSAVAKDLERLLVKLGMITYGPRGRELLSPGQQRIAGPIHQRGRRGAA